MRSLGVGSNPTGSARILGKAHREGRVMGVGAAEMKSDESDLERLLKRRRQVLSASERESRRGDEEALTVRWREVINAYDSTEEERRQSAAYPRWQRLFEIVREDGRIRLMLNYAHENPTPNFTDRGQRRQVECLLGFEQPLERLMEEASNRWQAGDFEAEAALLEEFANSNPQRDAILDLAAEARQDVLSGASIRHRPKRRNDV
jgi:hypothetical protein